jgi:hypothetical protein
MATAAALHMALMTRVLPLVTSTVVAVVVAWAETGDRAAVAVVASASTSVTRVIASTAMAAASATTLPAPAMPSTQFVLRSRRLYYYAFCFLVPCHFASPCLFNKLLRLSLVVPALNLQLTLQPRRPQQVSRHLLQIP